jgi:hypothetical protein
LNGKTAHISFLNVPLPVAGEIDALPALHRQRRNPIHLIAIGNAAVVLTPIRFLSIPQQVRASNVVMDPDLRAAQAREIFFRLIGAGTVIA